MPRRERGSTRPTRSIPGIDAPAEPWAAAIVPLLGLERRGSKLYLPGTSASLGSYAEAAAELEAQLGLEPVKVADPKLALFLEQQGRLVRLGDGMAVSAEAFERCAARRWSRNASLRAGSRSHVSATCSASVGARRSCCSSASTRTA